MNNQKRHTAGLPKTAGRFPSEARRRIGELLEDAAGRATAGAVVAGFFYRNHAGGDTHFSNGEEFPGAILGAPQLDGASLHTYFNCFWSDVLPHGDRVAVRFEATGVSLFETEIELQPGLNILHIPVLPTRPIIYVVPHSHFDTEWRRTYEEYLEQELPNLRSRLDLMQQQPSHCFSFDEECVTIPFMERSHEEYRARLRQGMRDGMVEPKGLVTQQELTMPYGESLVRCITMGERMLSELMGWSIRPEVYWCVDHYGMGAQMAQILRKSGRRYFLIGEYSDERIPYTEPGLREHQQFWLRSPDGSTMLANRGFYGGAVAPTAIPPKRAHQCGLQFLGEDNCPPRPGLVAEVEETNRTQSQYTYVISTTLPFFRAIAPDPDLPTFETESIVTRWCGIYESRLRSKTQNRDLENRILALEALASCARLEGMAYPATLERAWYLMILNQHHDPLMSIMAKPGLFDAEIPARFEQCSSLLDQVDDEVMGWLGAEIDTAAEAGEPLVAYNALPLARSAILEIEIGAEEGAGATEVGVVDHLGEPLACQRVDGQEGKARLLFRAEQLPALGWRPYFLGPAGDAQGPLNRIGRTDDAARRAQDVQATPTRMENEHLRVELANGAIARVIEKSTDVEALRASAECGVNEIAIWRDEGCISIVRPMDEHGVVDFLHNDAAVLVARSAQIAERQVVVLEDGPLRARLQIRFELDWGRFEQRLELESGSRLLRLTTRILWDPSSRIAPFDGRRVRLAFRTGFEEARVFCDSAFGVVPWKQMEQIRPVNSWLAAESSSCGVALFHKGTHSVQVVDDVIYATLIRSVVEPDFDAEDDRACKWDVATDEAAEAGTHILEHALYVYPGTWDRADVCTASRCFNSVVEVVPAGRHEGRLPAAASYLQLDPPTLVTSAVKPAEYRTGCTVIRLYNPTGRRVRGRLRLGFDHGAVEVVDFREEMVDTLGGANPYEVLVEPYEIVTLCIEGHEER